jgi:hypothetical protein
MASIYDIKCPNCKKAVWFNNGNESDLTTPDVEALSCPFCQTCFWLDPDDDMFLEDRRRPTKRPDWLELNLKKP